MNKKIKKSEHLVVRITTGQLLMLSDYVLKEDMTMSDLVRKALRQYMNDNKPTNK